MECSPEIPLSWNEDPCQKIDKLSARLVLKRVAKNDMGHLMAEDETDLVAFPSAELQKGLLDEYEAAWKGEGVRRGSIDDRENKPTSLILQAGGQRCPQLAELLCVCGIACRCGSLQGSFEFPTPSLAESVLRFDPLIFRTRQGLKEPVPLVESVAELTQHSKHIGHGQPTR